jgi:hypothetical protein
VVKDDFVRKDSLGDAVLCLEFRKVLKLLTATLYDIV